MYVKGNEWQGIVKIMSIRGGNRQVPPKMEFSIYQVCGNNYSASL